MDVSVDDARVEEGPGAVLEFPVMLDRALGTTVTVDWRTQDGSARAGSDYDAGSGTLTFHPGETAKTVRVTVLDDALGEGREFMLLELSNPSGADMDGEGTVAMGTIEDGDPMPQAWLAQFGRTVAEQVLKAVDSPRWLGAAAWGPRRPWRASASAAVNRSIWRRRPSSTSRHAGWAKRPAGIAPGARSRGR